MNRKAHWQVVYETKESADVSWYQAEPRHVLELLREMSTGPNTAIIDIGGGDSTLVDHVVTEQLGRITVLDISAAALTRARVRLSGRAELAEWIEADITNVELPRQSYDIWHDRAVFHFLTTVEERGRYVTTATEAVRVGGRMIISTFAPNGPSRCSGLDVVRYSVRDLANEFAPAFTLRSELTAVHRTPAGAEQHFTIVVLERQ